MITVYCLVQERCIRQLYGLSLEFADDFSLFNVFVVGHFHFYK